jgi:hypothetical protein
LAKRLLLRLFAGVALTFAPIAEAAPPSGIHTAQDLFDTCADSSPTAQAACNAYVHATIQTAEIMHAASNGGKLTPLFCPADSMGAQDLVAVLRVQADVHPERRNFPAPTVIIGGGIDTYPCPKGAGASTASPAHKAPPRRKRTS